MKILTISDRVLPSLYSQAIERLYPDVDLVLSCGDLPFYYLDYIATMLTVPLFYVLGNHDRPKGYAGGFMVKPQARGGMDVDGQVAACRGVLVGGLEGSMRYKPEGDYQYTETEMWLKVLQMTPRLVLNKLRRGRYLDILITHAPPRGIHDNPDPCHRGFVSFLWFMKRFRPFYLIHGHVHLYGPQRTQVTRYEATTVVNAYPARVLELDERRL
jgi:Icc-related predicted phosphoesterase